MTWLWIVLAVVVVLVAIAALWAYRTAVRLDRLHIRSDLAQAALVDALGRRCILARNVGNGITNQGDVHGSDTTDEAALSGLALELIAAADRAERAPWAQRPGCENEVSRLLDAVPQAYWPAHQQEEWLDVLARLRIARKFHNDAIRDARKLRQQRFVGVFKLAGRAPMPQYFDFSEGGEELAAAYRGSS